MMGSVLASCMRSLLIKNSKLGHLVWKSAEWNVSTVPVSVNWDTSAF